MKHNDKILLDKITAQLSRVQHFDDFSFVSTPLLLPNGGSVVVRISKNIEGFLVTDHGLGFNETELIDGGHYYSRIAPKVAKLSGITFDQHSYFVLQVKEEQLAGAIKTVANCVLESVTQVFYKVAEHKARLASDKMFERLTNIFDERFLTREYEVIGESTHSWTFDSALRRDDNIVVFDMVNKHHNSIYQAVTKFHDVARAEFAPKRVAVIGKQKEYSDLLPVLSQAANVVELNGRRETFLKLASAA